MSLIRNLKRYPSKTSVSKPVLLLCGFGGSVWQTKRLVGVLQRNGYAVTTLDFPKEVLSKGDPQLLPKLIAEVVDFADKEAQRSAKPMLLVGISLGALITLNILRRSALFDRGVLITGGDIVKVAHGIYGRKVWPQSYPQLAKQWQHINMYSEPQELAGKRLIFVLPAKDDLIDTSDIYSEIKKHNAAGNHLKLVERHSFGHIGTIVEETIVFPRRVLTYIEQIRN